MVENRMRLNPKLAALLIIDVQERFVPVIHDYPSILAAIRKIIRGAQVLEIPILLTEQYPKGLGQTVSEIRQLIPNIEAIEKLSFSCCGSSDFLDRLKELNRQQILVCGIETHVCVYQSCADLQDLGYEVHLLQDCVSSRKPDDRLLALQKLQAMGISMTGVEMALFEMLRVAGTPVFKEISRLVK